MKLILNTDGGARGNPGPAGIGVVIRDANGMLVSQHHEYIGQATNNVAEYKALILALEESKKRGADQVQINMDSELIVKQMKGLYKIKEPSLKLLAGDVQKLLKEFKEYTFTHVRREFNKDADKLVNLAIDAAT